MSETLTTRSTRSQWLFVVLAGFFVTNAVTAELISNKLIEIPVLAQWGEWKLGPFTTIVGILPWPVVFLVTDLINEFYGKVAVRRLSWITAGLIAYCFVIVTVALAVPAKEIPGSTLSTDYEFHKVFGQAQMVIVGSIAAFILSQLMDATIFQWIKSRTGNRYIWLRSTGSTVISQLVDSLVVLYIGFVLTGAIPMSEYLSIGFTNYSLKLIIAVALTPMIYAGHYAVRSYLKAREEV
jgi:queuosine precursor transporter